MILNERHYKTRSISIIKDIKRTIITITTFFLLSIQTHGINNACLENGQCPAAAEVYDDDDKWWREEGITALKIWYDFECENIFSKPRPVHSDATWLQLRNAYKKVVGSSNSTVDLHSSKSGFNVKIKAEQAEGKGRGVYITEPVKKGQLVWTATKQSARFKDGSSYKEFLFTIPVDLACDVMQWAYVQSFGKDDFSRSKLNNQKEGAKIVLTEKEENDTKDRDIKNSEGGDIEEIAEEEEKVEVGKETANRDKEVEEMDKIDEVEEIEEIENEEEIEEEDEWEVADEEEEGEEEEEEEEVEEVEEEEVEEKEEVEEIEEVEDVEEDEEMDEEDEEDEEHIVEEEDEVKQMKEVNEKMTEEETESDDSLEEKEEEEKGKVERQEGKEEGKQGEREEIDEEGWGNEEGDEEEEEDIEWDEWDYPEDWDEWDYPEDWDELEYWEDDELEEGQILLICVDLDEGSFMNSGYWQEEDNSNLGCISEAGSKVLGGCKQNYFALRDIDAGEELLVNYGEFALPHGWDSFGLQ